VSFKIIMTTSVTRPCFTTQHQTCKTKTKNKNTAYMTKTKTDFFWSQTRLVLRPTVSDHITGFETRCRSLESGRASASGHYCSRKFHFTFGLVQALV